MPTLATVQTFDDMLGALGLDSAELVRVLLRIVMIWALAWIGFRVVRLVAKRIEAAAHHDDDRTLTLREKRGQTIAQLIRGVGRALILFIAVLLTLNIFIDIGPLLAGAGVAGLAVSFGAQSLVKDVIAGFFIIFENQFAVGDNVELGGKSGVVERLTLRVVALRDVEGILHIIPNGAITVVSNKTRGWGRAVVEVGVAYGEDIDRALGVFRDEAQQFAKDAKWSARLDGEPEVWGVEKLTDNAVVVRTVVRTVPGEQWDVGREFRRRIKNRLDREGIEISAPQRSFILRQERQEDASAAIGPGPAA